MANANTLFKYHSQFQIPTGQGRSGGLDTYADWDVDLGAPIGPYEVQGELYRREFSGGLVLVVRDDADAPVTYQLERPMFTPDGERVMGTVEVAPGSGLILIAPPYGARFIANRPQRELFEDPDTPFATRRWASIEEEDGNHFLNLDATPADQQWEHDLLLEGVRSMRSRPDLSVNVRTSDPEASIELVAEVDDAMGQHQYVVIEVDGSSGVPGDDGIGLFPSYRAGGDWQPDIPHLRSGAELPSDSQWSRITIPADTLFEGINDGRYTFQRWSHMSMTGDMDVDNIVMRGGRVGQP